jgi:2-isopropylmalate synthase
MTTDHVRIFDTTLRDGEQSPGATMTSAEKLEVAQALARLGVDVIEAGFPAASPDDLEAVRHIAETVGRTAVEGRLTKEPPIICGLARTVHGDLEKAWQAVSPAKNPRIHTFIATSPIHREHKLRMSKNAILARITEMVTFARGMCPDIEFSAEDAGRTEMEFLYEAFQAAIEAGATTLNVPDTVGYTLPHEFGERIALLKQNVKGIDKCIISVHCHNDLGLATANSLAGVMNGARQVEVAINGIGERAGNTALEEIVMAIRTRKAMFGDIDTRVDSTHLMRVSKLVSTVTGMQVQPNKAIVGANAFAHESGIHQDGMLKNAETYEIMRPETVGAAQTELVLGKHSGRNAFASHMAELGYPIGSQTELARIFDEFKKLADKKKYITDPDLIALYNDQAGTTEEDPFQLVDLQVVSGSMGMPTATVRLKLPTGQLVTDVAVGTGPVDAAYKAIDRIVGIDAELLEYAVNSVTQGIDALGEVQVRVAPRGQVTDGALNPQNERARSRVFHGHGADTDIIVASAKAYLAALNRMLLVRAPGALPKTPSAAE